MKTLAAILVTLFFSLTCTSQEVKFSAKTGDAELDVFLKDINTNALSNPDQFKVNASASFNIGVTKIDLLLNTMPPGDVYMALQLASSTGKPVDTVVDSYSKNKGKGWGVIAKEMGIKPGSPEFHAMKKSLKEKKGKGNGGGNQGNKNKGKGKKK
jgi:hypothetical protein